MSRIPVAPLLLGLAGLIPFLWGMVTYLNADLANWGARTFGPRFVGMNIQLTYGTVILSFMSGVLWGFATKANGVQAGVGYALSTLPALWAFFMTGAGQVSDAMFLVFGFTGLLLLDAAFMRWGLAPPWWLRLRLLLSSVVIGCLCTGVIF